MSNINNKKVYSMIIDSNIVGYRKISSQFSKAVAYEFPISQFKKQVTNELLNKSGIYFLVEIETDKIYVGESENIGKRIQQHNTKMNKTIGDEKYKDLEKIDKVYVISFEEIDKTSLKWLEQKVIDLLKDSHRYNVTNTNQNYNSVIEGEKTIILHNQFLNESKELINVLGINISTVDEAKGELQDYEKLVFKIEKPEKDSHGEMIIRNGEFILKAGSVIAKGIDEKKHLSKWVYSMYEELKNKDRKIENDIVKSAPSLLAALITGNPSNGWKEWRALDENGNEVILEEFRDKILS